MRLFRNLNIAFLHVPKTGGSSLLQLLGRNYTSERMMMYYPPECTDVSRMAGSGNLFVGHYSMGKQHEVFDDCKLVTFLRDPIDRLISNIFYMQRYYSQPEVPPDSMYKKWFQENDDVFGVLRFTKLWYLDNAMVRMVSGVHDTVPFGKLDERSLERAKTNLHKFDFIGFQESFEDDVLRLCSRYQLKTVIGKQNHGFNRYAPAAKDHELLEARNVLDSELYQFARITAARKDVNAGKAFIMKAAGRVRNAFSR